ncbi:DNA replication protein [Artemisia annua]|uniref:DNA replication protein n=1 Tax=Artemisia annua TaxID=35608 RepID=A0A2U1MKP9_ARTAN|nr:DNA replication protein [Artemisia annua]
MDSGSGVFSDDYESLISTTDADLLKRSIDDKQEQFVLSEVQTAYLLKNKQKKHVHLQGCYGILNAHLLTENLIKSSLVTEETVEELMQNGEDPLTEETVEELMQNGEDPLTGVWMCIGESDCYVIQDKGKGSVAVMYIKLGVEPSKRLFNITRISFSKDEAYQKPEDGTVDNPGKKRLLSFLEIYYQNEIEKFMFHIQKTADLWARLSKQEQKFARRSIEDMKQHFEQSVLSKLPERYNSHSKQSVISEETTIRTRKFLGALPVDDRQVILCLLLILGHICAALQVD